MIRTALFVQSPGFPEVTGLAIPRGDLDASVQLAKRLGYDGIELTVGDPAALDAAQIKATLARHGMAIAALNSGGINYLSNQHIAQAAHQPTITLVNADPQAAALAFEKFQTVIRLAGQLGCLVQLGIFRGTALPGKPIAFFRQQLVDVLRAACDYAAEHQVTITLEYTNRFETNTINSCAEAIEVVDRVGKDNLAILLDTYHSYLEDPDVYDTLLAARDYIKYIHLHDSDRGPAGASNGVLDFDRIFAVLDETGYRGFVADGLLTTALPEEQVRRSTAYLRSKIAALAGRSRSV